MLSEWSGKVFEDYVIVAREICSRCSTPQPLDFYKRMFDWRSRLKDALLSVGKCLIPRGEDQLARHQKTGRVEIRLPFLALLGLARPANERGRRGPSEHCGLRWVLGEQVAMQPPMSAALMPDRVAVTPFLCRVLIRVESSRRSRCADHRRRWRQGYRDRNLGEAHRTICGCHRTRCRA